MTDDAMTTEDSHAQVSVRRYLLREINQGATPELAVDQFIGEAEPEMLGALVRPVLLYEARQMERRITRQMEDEVAERIRQGEDPISVRRKLLGHFFSLPNGRHVEWLKATEDEHLLRAEWQRNHAEKCMTDADRHEEAARLIREAGASCLADLDEATLMRFGPDLPSEAQEGDAA